jgi:hypothetical protein
VTANGIGDVALIEPGLEAWSTRRGHAGADSIEDGKPGEPVGGIVYWITECLNTDTGEIERAFLCVDHTRTRPRLRSYLLRESEIDRGSVALPESHDAVYRRIWRRAGEDIAFVKRYHDRTGPAVAEEARLGLILYAFLGLVFGPDGVLHAALTPPAPSQQPCAPRPSGPPAPGGMFVD